MITIDIEVPTIVPKDERKRNPDKVDFDKKMRDLDTKIEGFREKMRSLG